MAEFIHPLVFKRGVVLLSAATGNSQRLKQPERMNRDQPDTAEATANAEASLAFAGTPANSESGAGIAGCKRMPLTFAIGR